ncbi:MAG: NUDIX domain-containing protein [Lachnospiraceae bacterium]|nr:NUDIX domain-containing protein [Lachnospiraceae bacterium]
MELLDIVDENGQPTGGTVERTKAHAEGIRHRTSHVWLVRKRNGHVEVLLQKRSDNKDSFPGCFDISSAGHIPAGVDFIPSAVRELKEELGIDISGDELILCGNRDVAWDTEFYGKPFRDRQYSRIFALWCDKDESEFVLQEEEVSGVMWMDLDEAIKAVEAGTIRHCIYTEELMMVRRTVIDEL